MDPIPRLMARLNSARLADVDVASGSQLYADMACQLCMMTSSLHQAYVILDMPTVHTDVTIISCRRHPYLGQSCGSGNLVFGSGQPIRAKKTRAARLCAWPATSLAHDGACGHFQRLILMLFSLVASSLPPLHSGMVKTQF